jgi:hypothetical protein
VSGRVLDVASGRGESKQRNGSKFSPEIRLDEFFEDTCMYIISTTFPSLICSGGNLLFWCCSRYGEGGICFLQEFDRVSHKQYFIFVVLLITMSCFSRDQQKKIWKCQTSLASLVALEISKSLFSLQVSTAASVELSISWKRLHTLIAFGLSSFTSITRHSKSTFLQSRASGEIPDFQKPFAYTLEQI